MPLLLPSPFQALTVPGTPRGIFMMLMAGLSGVLMVAIIRDVTQGMHLFQAAFLRTLFGLMMFLPWFLPRRLHSLSTQRLGLHMARAVLQVGGILAFFMGVSMTPLATVAALGFTTPLFSTILALIILGEIIRARRITALAVGFAGTWVILRPGMIEPDAGALFVLLASMIWGVTSIIIKLLSRTDSSIALAVYPSVLVIPLTFIVALPVWETPTAAQLGLLVLAGALNNVDTVCFALAMKNAELTAVLPADFMKLVWATMIGYFLFAETPDIWTFVGAVMIFAAVAYIAYRESQLRAKSTNAP